MNKIKQYIDNFNDREKKMVGVASLIVVCFILYLILQKSAFIFAPSKKVQAVAKKEQFERLLPKILQLKKLKKEQHNFQKIADDNIYEHIKRNTPKLNVLDDDIAEINDLDDKAEIRYKAVSFDDLMLWLERLHKQYGITVSSADIEQVEGKKGFVSAILILS